MALYISPGRYRLTLANESVSSESWDTLEAFSNLSTTLALNSIYTANSATVSLQGTNDVMTLGVATQWRMTLNGVENVRASVAGVDLVLYDDVNFTTNGTLASIRSGYLDDQITYTGVARDSSLIMGSGTDQATFDESSTYYGYIKSNAGTLKVYDFSTGKAVNVDATVDKIKVGSNAAVTTSSISNNSQQAYGAFDVTSVAATTTAVTFSTTKLKAGAAEISGSTNSTTITTNGAQSLSVTAQTAAVDGQLRVYVGDSSSGFYEDFKNVYLGTTGADSPNKSSAGAGAIVFGFGGADNIIGSAHNDSLFGGAGDDTIADGGGLDIIEGGTGADTINLQGNTTTSDRIKYNFAGANFAADGPAAGAVTGYDTIDGFDGGASDQIWLSGFALAGGRILNGSNTSTQLGTTTEVAISAIAGHLMITGTSVNTGLSLAEDIASAIDAAFDLTTAAANEYLAFSVEAADIDADGNGAGGTKQYWFGIYKNVGAAGGARDDDVGGVDVQILGLISVTQGNPDYDNIVLV